jgi:transcriptional regulator with XRE-family HTH domain
VSDVAREFGNKLREARNKADLSQEEVAGLTGLSRGVISPLERGEHLPRLDTLLKLAGAVGVDPCALLTDFRWKPPVVKDRPPKGKFQRQGKQ